jgi:hypothetical protein
LLASSVLECIDSSGSWPIFLNKSGDDPFVISFPRQPIIEDTGDLLACTAVDTSIFPVAVYGLTFYKNPIIPGDPFDLFEQVVRERAQSPTCLLWKHVSVEEDAYILDILSKAEQLKVFRKERIIVTGDNVYFLFTIFFPHATENHDYFIHSFQRFTD